MALLGEAIVEEWLNRSGYFTIRGVKLGIHEMDILAVRLENGRSIDLRHIECQISFKPISWITPATAEMQKAGWKAYSPKPRTKEVISKCVSGWIDKKFLMPEKHRIRQRLCSGEWSKELVLGKAKYQTEIDELKKQGIRIIKFEDVLRSLMSKSEVVSRAVGGDIFELMNWLSHINMND
jgi:hypothetical protein